MAEQKYEYPEVYAWGAPHLFAFSGFNSLHDCVSHQGDLFYGVCAGILLVGALVVFVYSWRQAPKHMSKPALWEIIMDIAVMLCMLSVAVFVRDNWGKAVILIVGLAWFLYLRQRAGWFRSRPKEQTQVIDEETGEPGLVKE